MASVWQELKRRNVVRVGVGYTVVAWLLLQIADVVLNNISAPSWVFQAILLLLALGFPLALFFAWAFELTPDGLRKEKDVDRSASITHSTGRKLDFIIIGVLSLALVMFAIDRFALTTSDSSEVTATGQLRTIAVLPFENFSEDPNNEYFADGISEEILNLLAGIPELRVTSRSSAFSFKGQNVDIPTIAAKLNVAHVLEGSVRKSGDKLRITAQLIEVNSDSHLWSETYDREFENVFAIQDEIAASVADAMQITLLGKKPKTKETDPEAYALYLQGLHFFDLGTEEGLRRAGETISQALEIAPGYAPARVELGWTYIQQATMFGLITYDEASSLASQAFQTALAADPEYGRAYGGLAYVTMFYGQDFKLASEYLQQGLDLGPGDSALLGTLAQLETAVGRVEEAIALIRQTIARDPLNGHLALGRFLYFAGHLDEAADSLRLDLSLNPDAPYPQYVLGLVLMAQGETLAALMKIKEVPDDGWRLAGTAYAQHALGDNSASNAALDELIERFSADMAYQIAAAYAVRGDVDNAFEWLERAYENHDTGLLTLLVDPLLSNLHEEPRWIPFLNKMGLPQ
jgi:TolB-like protein/Tfp pilus assembly protein PilF